MTWRASLRQSGTPRNRPNRAGPALEVGEATDQMTITPEGTELERTIGLEDWQSASGR